MSEGTATEIAMCGKSLRLEDYVEVHYSSGGTISGKIIELWSEEEEGGRPQARVESGWCFHDSDRILKHSPARQKVAMGFGDVMDAMRWAAQETDDLRQWQDTDPDYEDGHQNFGEAVAWLQDNQEAIEGLPTLVADSLRMCDEVKRLKAERDTKKEKLDLALNSLRRTMSRRDIAYAEKNKQISSLQTKYDDCREQLSLANERITALTGMPFSDRMHAALQSRVKLAEARSGELAVEDERLTRLIDTAVKPWISLQKESVIEWDGSIDGAMKAACFEIRRLRVRVGRLKAERDALLEAMEKFSSVDTYMSTTHGRNIARKVIADCKQAKPAQSESNRGDPVSELDQF